MFEAPSNRLSLYESAFFFFFWPLGGGCVCKCVWCICQSQRAFA